MNQVAISFGSDNPLVVAQWQAMLRGLRGLSAYEVAVKNGFVGTEAEWLESLHGGGSGGSGPAGLSAYQVAVKNGFVGTEAQWLASLEGRPGADSTVPGPPGLSAYEIAVKNGFVGDESDWEASLIGPPGQDAAGGGERSRADRVLQGVINQAVFTMGNNRFSNRSPLRDAPTITPIGAIESFMTRGYSAITGGIKPWNILGGAPVVDGFGLRGVNTTFNANTKFSILYQVDQIIDGNECNVLLEQGPQYRFLVEEDGYMKYVPDANVTLASGIEKQHYRIAFPNTTGPRVRRRFWIESGYDKEVPGTQVNTAGRFGGTYVRKADQIMRPAKPQFRSVHIGDSNIMGVNGPHGASHSAVMAAHLGLNDHWVSAIHSTGELQANIGGYVWHERRNDWRDPRPHFLFFNLSWVDRQVVLNGEFTPAQAAARLMGEFNAARSEFPELVVVVLGLIWSVEEYALHPDIQLMNVAIRDAIAAKGDPLLIYMEGSRYPETPLTGRGQQGSEMGQGNADIYFGQDGHYSRLGDEWTGITEAHDLLELLTTAFYNQASTEAVPRIMPSSATVTGTVGVAVDRLLASVSNATPTSVTGAAPAGTSFVIVGAQLRLQGTYTVATAGQAFPITVKTSGGADLSFMANVTVVAAPVASISPSSGNATGTVGDAVNALLGTVSNGTPSGVTGTAPPGTAFFISGQQLRLQGTYTGATSGNFTATVLTPNGSPTFALAANIAAAPIASISPTSVTQSSTVGQFRNGQVLAQVSNGTPTAIVSGTPPAGMEFTLSGPNLVMSGTYTTPATNNATVVLATSAGNTVTFTLNDTVAATSVASINPTGGTATGTVGTAMDVLLSTVSGGTPSGLTGAAPPGTAFAMVGQQLRLQGTPTAASTANFTATVATPNGNPTFVMTAAISAAGAGLVLADLKFNGTNGQKGIMQNDAPDSPEKLVFETYGPAQLSTGVGVKSGTTCLDYNHNNYDGSNCASQVEVNLDSDFELQFWFTRVSGYENTGSMFGFGDYGGASYLDVECPNNRLTFYRTPAQGDAIAEGAENSGDLLVPDTPVFVTVVRLNGLLRMTVNGQTAIGPVSSPEPVTGRVALLQVPNTGYGWPYARMDSFKLTKGDAEYKAFPFTPPTT